MFSVTIAMKYFRTLEFEIATWFHVRFTVTEELASYDFNRTYTIHIFFVPGHSRSRLSFMKPFFPIH